MKGLFTGWKTSIGGVIMLVCASAIVLRDSSKLSNPEVVALIAGGAALIKAADGK